MDVRDKFIITVNQNSYYINDSVDIDNSSNSTLIVLKRIQRILDLKIPYTSLQSNKYSKFSKESLFGLLGGLNKQIYNTYLKTLNSFELFLNINKEYEKIYCNNDIKIQNVLFPPTVLPLPDEIIDHIFSLMKIKGLALLTLINHHGNACATRVTTKRAIQYGYYCNHVKSNPFQFFHKIIRLKNELENQGIITNISRNLNNDDFLKHFQGLTLGELTSFSYTPFGSKDLNQTFFKIIYKFIGDCLSNINPENTDYNLISEILYRILMNATRRGDNKVVQKVLLIDINKKLTIDQKNQALHLAATNGNIEIIQTLLKYSADKNSPNEWGNTPLSIASKKGQSTSVEFLLGIDVDVTHLNKEGDQALHLAAANGYTDIVKLLLDYGVNAKIPDGMGWQISHYAAATGNIEMLKIAIAYGAEVNAVKKEGDTPLIIACMYRYETIVEYLLNLDADFDIKNNKGEKAVHYAKETTTLELLIRKGADVNAQDMEGKTPLMIAVALSLNLSKYLLENGARANIKDNKENQALHFSVEYPLIAERLLQYGAEINVRNMEGFTPLGVALHKRDMLTAAFLKSRGGTL